MRTSPPRSSTLSPPVSADAAHRNKPFSEQRLAAGVAPETKSSDVILKTIAQNLARKGRDNLHLSASTFERAVFMATPHLKLARPNDLRALIAAHTDALGRIACSHITKITLSHSSFTDADLASLQKFTSLHEVDFSDCTNITGLGIAKLPRAIKVANFTGCNAVTDEGFATLPPDLDEVNFTDCTKFTRAGLANVPRTVKVADFTGCIGLANVGKEAFPPSLEHVIFTDCANLSDADLANLPRTVTRVDVVGCPRISANMIESLRRHGVRVTSAQPLQAVFTVPNLALRRAPGSPE